MLAQGILTQSEFEAMAAKAGLSAALLHLHEDPSQGPKPRALQPRIVQQFAGQSEQVRALLWLAHSRRTLSAGTPSHPHECPRVLTPLPPS